MGGKPLIGPTASRLLEEQIEDELIIYDPDSTSFVTLNHTAATVWRLATGELTLEELTEVVAEAYDSDAASVTEDVAQIVESFRAQHLLEE